LLQVGARKKLDRCDVVIVNFETGDFLKGAIESVLQSPAVAHVYIIDNASTDLSLDFLQQSQNDRLTVIRNPKNVGYATACNIGLARTRFEQVLLLNPDCKIEGDAVERLMAALSSDTRIGMVGPLLLNADGSEQLVGRRQFPMPETVLAQAFGGLSVRRRLAGDPPLQRDAMLKESIEVDAISGACMMVRRAAITDVGPFDEQYFLHGEDLDWCMRFHIQSWKILFVPAARVVHYKGVSSRHRPVAVEYHKHKGMIRFYRKYLGGTYSRWLMALLVAGVWMRFVVVASWRLISGGAARIHREVAF
jgi:GT2 family glycosyltransferase